ncbi:MAG: GntR family transcriptional regulator [Candidatus Izemoplasmataceae bacterium]
MESLSVRTTSQTPIYQQLYDQISSQIVKGTLKADTLLPSIRKMAKELRVSIITVKKAWELLEQNGYIYTVAGKGSYVKKNTASMLESKKNETVRDALKEVVSLSKQLDVSKEELLKIASDLFEE